MDLCKNQNGLMYKPEYDCTGITLMACVAHQKINFHSNFAEVIHRLWFIVDGPILHLCYLLFSLFLLVFLLCFLSLFDLLPSRSHHAHQLWLQGKVLKLRTFDLA